MKATRTIPPLDENHKDRFWSKVNKNGPIHPYLPELGNCWLWIGAKTGTHYGAFTINGEQFSAHRISCSMGTGIKPGQFVLHSCDVPECVNPYHLRGGSVRENALDALSRNRLCSGDRQWTRVHPERLKRGESHHFSKLVEHQVLEIRRLRTLGATTNELRLKFNVCRNLILMIVNRSIWTHI